MAFVCMAAVTFHLFTLAAVVCLVGCASTADVARYETSSVCEVHHSAMIVEEVPCISGTSVYLSDFSAALSREFPHYGRAHFVEDHVYVYARRMKLHVCPECTKAYDEWHAQRRNRQHAGPFHVPQRWTSERARLAYFPDIGES